MIFFFNLYREDCDMPPCGYPCMFFFSQASSPVPRLSISPIKRFFFHILHLEAVPIDAPGCQAKILALTGYMGTVCIEANSLACPDYLQLSSSFFCQLLARAWAAESSASILACPCIGRVSIGNIQTAP